MKNQTNAIRSKSKPKPISQPFHSESSIKPNTAKTKKKKKAIPSSLKQTPYDESTCKSQKERRFKTTINSEDPYNEEEKAKELFTNYSHVISEKTTKESLKRLIETSNDLLSKQNDALNKCDELAKVISANDYEVDRLIIKQERDNFAQIMNEHTCDLDNILNKLRRNTTELDNAKRLKEENNSLKYKLEMLSIDKNDDYLSIESKINSMRNVYSSEINSMMNFFNEMGLDNPIPKMTSGSFTEDKVIQFFSLCKKHMKAMKNTILGQEEKIEYLSHENLKFSEDMDNAKRKADQMLRKKNMEFSESLGTSQMVMAMPSMTLGGSCPYSNDQLKSQSYNNQSQIITQEPFQGGLSQSTNNMKDDRSFMDVYKRNKDLRYSNDETQELGLEHKYTDSCFYQPNEESQNYTYQRNNIMNTSNPFYQ